MFLTHPQINNKSAVLYFQEIVAFLMVWSHQKGKQFIEFLVHWTELKYKFDLSKYSSTYACIYYTYKYLRLYINIFYIYLKL